MIAVTPLQMFFCPIKNQLRVQVLSGLLPFCVHVFGALQSKSIMKVWTFTVSTISPLVSWECFYPTIAGACCYSKVTSYMKVKVHCQKVIDRDNSPRTATWSPHFFLAMYYGTRLEGQSAGVGTKRESGVSALRGVSPYISVSGTNLAMRRFCLRNIFQQPPLSVKCQFSIEEQESRKKTAASAFCLPFIWTHWKWHEAFV